MLYSTEYMVKTRSHNKTKKHCNHCITPLPISSKGSFICMIPDRLVHTTAFDTLDMEHWLEHITAQWDQSNRCYQKVDTYLQIIAKSIVECWLRFENPTQVSYQELFYLLKPLPLHTCPTYQPGLR